MKKLLLLLLSATILFILSGCKKKDPTDVHYYTNGSFKQSTIIIYDVDSEPLEIRNKSTYWDIENIVLDIKFGWNENFISSAFSVNDKEVKWELVSFAYYFSLQTYKQHKKYYKDYKNLDDGIYIGEIDKDIFLSDVYKANLGDNLIPFYSNPPIFNSENKGIKLHISLELIEKIREIQGNDIIKFRFDVTPVYLNPVTGEYIVDFLEGHDGFRVTIYPIVDNPQLVHLDIW